MIITLLLLLLLNYLITLIITEIGESNDFVKIIYKF